MLIVAQRHAICLALGFQKAQLAGFQVVLADSDWDLSRLPVMIHFEGRLMNQAASEKAFKGFGMEGFTARWYASLTRKSLDEFKSLAQRVAQQIPPGSQANEHYLAA